MKIEPTICRVYSHTLVPLRHDYFFIVSYFIIITAENTSNFSPTRRNQPEMERTYWSESNQNNDSGPSR